MIISSPRMYSIISSVLRNDSKSFFSIYILICFIVALPVIYGIYGFLYLNEVPAGGDPANHVFFVERILRTGNPLIPYLQFSDLPGLPNNSGVGYYPSLLHILVAVTSYITSFGSISVHVVLQTFKSFMFIQYLVGIIGYALLLKTIIYEVMIYENSKLHWKRTDAKYTIACYAVLVLAFGLFIYSTSPLIKTFRDGGYGEILAMWCIFPFYLYFLLRKRWIISAVLLAIIGSTHNLSFIMTLLATLAYFIKLLLSGQYIVFKKSKVFFVSGLIFCAPGFILFYLPSIITSVNSGTGVNSGLGVPQNLSRADIAEQVTPVLYYFGVVGLIGLVIFNYKLLGWVSAWTLLYFPIFNSSILAIRFSREISLPLGVIVGLFSALIMYKLVFTWYEKYTYTGRDSNLLATIREASYRNKHSIQTLVCALFLVSALYFYFEYFRDRFEVSSDKETLNYYTPTFAQTNNYLLNKETQINSRDRLLSFGSNPWLKPFLYGKFVVMDAIPKEDEMTLSLTDRTINSRLLSVLQAPASPASERVLADLNIRYIIVSTIIPERWYPASFVNQDSKISDFQPDFDSSIITLDKNFKGALGEEIMIYAVNNSKLLRD